MGQSDGNISFYSAILLLTPVNHDIIIFSCHLTDFLHSECWTLGQKQLGDQIFTLEKSESKICESSVWTRTKLWKKILQSILQNSSCWTFILQISTSRTFQLCFSRTFLLLPLSWSRTRTWTCEKTWWRILSAQVKFPTTTSYNWNN